MIFVFPMAGESRRFRDAGYEISKFMLPLGKDTVFDRVLLGFRDYFHQDQFLFVLRRQDEEFVRGHCANLRIAQPLLALLDRPTSGQAETVLMGLDQVRAANTGAIGIFNIDTFHSHYRKPAFLPDCDGYLEVFKGGGDNWSFVRMANNRVAEVREKQAISDLCCTGFYYFRRTGDFRAAYRSAPTPKTAAERRERYVAPLYNTLVGKAQDIRCDVIARDAVIFCGTPAEYEALKQPA